MKYEETLGLVINRYKHAESERQIYDNKWDALYDMYRFKIKKPVAGRANLYIPYAFSNVETVFPRMVARRPRVQVKPRGPQDIEKSEVMKSLIDYAWETLKLDSVVRRWVKSMLIYGTGIVKVTWKKEIKSIRDIEPIFDEAGEVVDQKEVSVRKVTYDAPVVTNLDLRDVFFDPDGATIDDCRWLVHRYMATKQELEANPNFRKKDLKQITYGFTNDEIRRGLHSSSRHSLASADEAEVLEYWEDDRLVVIAGGVVLRDEPNPYDCKKKPFVVVVDQIDDQILYGIGEIEPVETLQAEMNTLRNQRMDYNNLILNPVFNVRAGSVQDINSIKFTPGWKNIVQGDSQSVTQMNMNNAPQTSYHEEESIKMDLQTVTGVSDYARGSEAASMNDTATGISLIQEAANQRFNAKLQNLESGLQELAELLRDLYIQFAQDEMVIRITEKDGFSFKDISPEDIRGEFDIAIEAGSTMPANKMQDRNEEMNKYNVLMANPLVQQSASALLESVRGLLTKWEDPSAENILAALTEKVGEIEEVKQIEKENAMAMMEEEEPMMGGAPDPIGMGAMKAAGPMDNPEAEAAMMELANSLGGNDDGGQLA